MLLTPPKLSSITFFSDTFLHQPSNVDLETTVNMDSPLEEELNTSFIVSFIALNFLFFRPLHSAKVLLSKQTICLICVLVDVCLCTKSANKKQNLLYHIHTYLISLIASSYSEPKRSGDVTTCVEEESTHLKKPYTLLELQVFPRGHAKKSLGPGIDTVCLLVRLPH